MLYNHYNNMRQRNIKKIISIKIYVKRLLLNYEEFFC